MAEITITIKDTPQGAVYEVKGDAPATHEESVQGTNAQSLTWSMLQLLNHLLRVAALAMPKH